MKYLRLENYSLGFWSHLDAIGAVLSLLAFSLVTGILIPHPELNFNPVTQGILGIFSIFSIITFVLLLLPLILMATNFIQEKEEIDYILGIKPRDKLGMEEEGKRTFGQFKKIDESRL